AVACVPRAKLADHGEEHFPLVEQRHCFGQHRHQILALLVHVAPKQRAQGGIEFKQSGVKQRRRLIGDGNDLAKRTYDYGDFGGSHGKGSRFFSNGTDAMNQAASWWASARNGRRVVMLGRTTWAFGRRIRRWRST